LRNDLASLDADPRRNKYTSQVSLCKTLSGLDVPLLTVTSQRSTKEMLNEKPHEKKKCVVLSARVHPGETVGSWMMRGAINFLTDPDN